MFSMRRMVNVLIKSNTGQKASCRRWLQEVAAERWQLLSGVYLERAAVITAEPTPIEAEYKEMMAAMEVENSNFSSHELKHLDDLRQAERMKREGVEQAKGTSYRKTALDLEDSWEEQMQLFTPASRTTEADSTGDTKSLDRALEHRLVLVVKQDSAGEGKEWILPQSVHRPGESLRQSAERTVREVCGGELEAHFMGNAPVGVYKVKYPQPADDGTVGAKVFFFKAQLRAGTVDPKLTPEYQWLKTDELTSQLNGKYSKSVSQFILDL